MVIIFTLFTYNKVPHRLVMDINMLIKPRKRSQAKKVQCYHLFSTVTYPTVRVVHIAKKKRYGTYCPYGEVIMSRICGSGSRTELVSTEQVAGKM